MKRIGLIFLTLCLVLSLALPALGTEAGNWVVDDAGLLTPDEIGELSRQIENLRDQLELDIVIVTVYGTGSKNVQAYADDFYDQHGYGYGTDHSGILLLLDMEAREWYMSTCGDAIYIFTDYGLEQLGQEIIPWLSAGDYYHAFQCWLSELSPYVKAFRNGSPIDGFVDPDDYESPNGDEIYYYDDHVGTRISPFPIALIVGLIAAIITIVIMRGKMNTARAQSGAADYLKKGSFRLRQRSDAFLYSRVTRSAKPKQSLSSGGGSSVHRSSGGVSHGGRGGKF